MDILNKKEFLNLAKTMPPDILEYLTQNTKLISNNTPGIEDIKEACKLINNPIPLYDKLSYFYSTQNERYIAKIIPEKLNSAFVITGPGDALLELISKGATTITSTDTNHFQTLIFKLRAAAILTLSNKDFRKFIINNHDPKFLSLDIFQTVKEGFKNDEAAINFWENILRNNPKDLLTYFFKPNIASIDKIEYAMPYYKNKQAYYKLSTQLEKANITLLNKDAITYLLNTNEKFDYIDITNILLYVYQLKCHNNINEYINILLQLKNIFIKNLNDGGTFTIDYMFSMTKEKILSHDIDDLTPTAYNTYYNVLTVLQDIFDLETITIDKIINCDTPTPDTIVYTRKLTK